MNSAPAADPFRRKPFDLESLSVAPFLFKAPKQQWLIPDVVAMGRATPIFLSPLQVIDIAMSVSSGDPEAATTTLGRRVNHHGAAVVLSAFSSTNELRWQMHEVDPSGRRRAVSGKRLMVVPDANCPSCLFRGGWGRSPAVDVTPDWFDLVAPLHEIERQGEVIKLLAFDPVAHFTRFYGKRLSNGGDYRHEHRQEMHAFNHLARTLGASVLMIDPSLGGVQ